MSKAVDIFSGILFVRTRHYDDVKKVVVLQGNKPERRFFEEQPQGEWISLSDNRPVSKGYYLTTTIHYEVYYDYWNGENFDRTEAVIAWMPLPEPYKKEGESDVDS